MERFKSNGRLRWTQSWAICFLIALLIGPLPGSPAAYATAAATHPSGPGAALAEARACSAEKIQEILAPASAAAPDVRVDCDLSLSTRHSVTKKLIFEGRGATGLTLSCNFASTRAIEIRSRRYHDPATSALRFEAPEDVTIRDCNVSGHVSVFGMLTADVIASSRSEGHVARVRDSAPKNITLDNLTITGVDRIPLYVFPGVAGVQLLSSELAGTSTYGTAIYLDVDSHHNVIKDNYIHVNNADPRPEKERELIAIDGSSHNLISGNRLFELDRGGIYLYRNCGERGAIRHSTPSHNSITGNYFYYDRYTGSNPAIYLGSRNTTAVSPEIPFSSWCDDDLREDGTPYPFGSSISNLDYARHNLITGNQIRKRLVDEMIRVQNPAANCPNTVAGNVTVTEAGGQVPSQRGGAPFLCRLYLPTVEQPGYVAFASDRDTGSFIVAMSPDGGPPRNLTSPTANDDPPQPSPDGRLIAFFSTRSGANGAYLMESDGSNQRWLSRCNICKSLTWAPDSSAVLLTVHEIEFSWTGGPPVQRHVTYQVGLDGSRAEQTYGYEAAWSPDGQLIAFLDLVGGRGTLLIGAADSAARAPVEVGDESFSDLDLTWSPGGAWLAFRGSPDYTTYALYAVGRTGRVAKRLAERVGSPAIWSPDGTRIAFLGAAPEGEGRTLFLVAPDGGGLTRLAEGVGSLPVWSPDGTQIAFLSAAPEGEGRTLFLVAPDGGGLTRLADDVHSWQGWSPDGELLAFSQGEPHQVVLSTRAGAVTRRIDVPGRALNLQWSPDGTRIAFNVSPPEGDVSTFVAGRAEGLRKVGEHWLHSWTPDGLQLLAHDSAVSPPMLYVAPLGEPLGRPLAAGNFPAIAPGGRRIAYLHDGQLHIMADDGSGQRRLTSDMAITERPLWSPDGAMIAFLEGSTAGATLSVIGGDGAGLRRLVTCPGGCKGIAWSPDGSRLALVVQPRHPSVGDDLLYVIGRDDPGPPRVVRCSLSCSEPSWSPDGATILFSDGDYFTGATIFLLSAAEGAPRELREGADPIWSPDGRQILFELGSTLLVARADGSGERALVSYDQVVDISATWSPDGRLVSVSVYGDSSGKASFYDSRVIRVDTGENVAGWPCCGVSWFGRGTIIAYLRTEEFGFYNMAYYIYSSAYIKLCLTGGPREHCTSMPYGHGNVLSYDVAP